MVDFRFRVYNRNLGTRILGVKVRTELMKTIEDNPNDKVVLDFSGVDVVSNAFADECLVKASENITLQYFVQRTTFLNVNSLAKTNIAIAFKRRYPQVTQL